MRLRVALCFLALLAAVRLFAQQKKTTSARPAPWSDKYERTVGGPEADLVVRTGDINNLGFGWPQNFDPFSGMSTPGHGYPWTPGKDEPAGTDRIMLGSAVTDKDVQERAGDGYAGNTKRPDNLPQAIVLKVGALPPKINAVLFQMFLDDFQAPVWHSQFQVSLNGTRIPQFEQAINSLEQTGPIGKLVTLKLLPEYWPLLKSGTARLLIDDPTTHAPDGYAIDFVRILVNPHSYKNVVSITGSVTDADTHKPILGATLSAALVSSAADSRGHYKLEGVPAGMVVVNATAAGYDDGVKPVDLEAGGSGTADFELHKHREGAADLQRAIDEKGSAAIYGLHFDTASAKLRPDSEPALQAILQLIKDKPGSRWILSGHTDNQGGALYNQKLSEARAASVVAWLTQHGIAASQLKAEGFGDKRPAADNATENGRAMNRRVEIALAP